MLQPPFYLPSYVLSNPFPSKPSIVFSAQKPFYSQPNYCSWWFGIFWCLLREMGGRRGIQWWEGGYVEPCKGPLFYSECHAPLVSRVTSSSQIGTRCSPRDTRSTQRFPCTPSTDEICWRTPPGEYQDSGFIDLDILTLSIVWICFQDSLSITNFNCLRGTSSYLWITIKYCVRSGGSLRGNYDIDNLGKQGRLLFQF